MNYKRNHALVPFARNLRKNMTEEERRLWYAFLRDYPIRFVRQKIVDRYILDFYCARAKLAVELDGSQHYDDEGLKKDRERTAFLEQYGIKVIRVQNTDVKSNFYGVCQYIDERVKEIIGC